MDQNAQNELALNLRRDDYDHFLAAQLAPSAKRTALYVIAAFHAELVHITRAVSEPLIGHIRLAWWREGLDDLLAGKKPRGHPVMLALAEVLATHPDIASLLYQAIAARAADFDEDMALDEHYHEHTAGALHLAWALVLDAAAAREYEQTILAAARAYALGETPANTTLPRTLKPLSGMVALAKLRARGHHGKLRAVLQMIKLHII